MKTLKSKFPNWVILSQSSWTLPEKFAGTIIGMIFLIGIAHILFS